MPNKSKAKAKIEVKEEKGVTVAIVPHEKVEMERIYSNFVAVRHTPYDFTLEFCEFLPVSEGSNQEVRKSKQVNAEIKAKILMPTQIIPALIEALADNYDKYEKTYGEKAK
jgi:hypothetical protein